jgi:hypothetical protein
MPVLWAAPRDARFGNAPSEIREHGQPRYTRTTRRGSGKVRGSTVIRGERCVRPSDAEATIGDRMSDRLTDWAIQRNALPTALEANRERRARAEAEVAAARDQLRALLASGSKLGFDVTQMARSAGVSRDTAHRLLRDAGVPSWSGRHRLAERAGIPSGPARAAWFADQGWGD